ncbi:MAG: hypothetical protein IJ511_00330 [Bacteroides sp.]|nr:hypothetical protein [Bacteroides sp.]
MKRIILLTALCGVFSACEDVEKRAALKLQEARTAYENGAYNEAKSLIDSIKILYPKAYDTRHEGIVLMQEVDLKEQEKSLAFLNEELGRKQQELEGMKKKFVLEKNAEYQKIGFYLSPSQVIEKNINRSYLRFQCDETGQMSMTTIYCGNRHIHHTGVKVTAPDGTFAETPAAKECYESENLGIKSEKAEFKLGEEGNVIDFICLNKGKNLKVTYQGEQSHTATLPASDKEAAAQVRELSLLLSGITEIKKEMEECKLKISFIERKKAEREAAASPTN